MKRILQAYFDSLLQVIFPHNCANFHTDILHKDAFVCSQCYMSLTDTGFFEHDNNPMEKMFYGRVKIASAASGYYYHKQTIIQSLIFQLKYKGNKEAGIFFGKQLGKMMTNCNRFDGVDAIVPLPLNKKKEQKRGYNQSMVIAQGIVEEFNRPILNDVVIRTRNTETQTKKKRIGRLLNMQEVFAINNAEKLSNKHILLIDDVITTGATLESCASVLLTIADQVSIVTVAKATF